MNNKPNLRFKEFNDDWLTTTIGKVSQGSLSYGMNAAAKDFDGTNKYIRITDIDEFSNKYLYDNVVSPAGKLDNNFLLKNNDIIFARTGASTGKTYLYNPEDGILYYAGFLIKAHIKDDICAKFIFYCTKLDKYKKWVSITSLRSGQPGINAQEYSNYKFKIPTLLEQEKIAGFLSKVDELINECEGEVKDLEEQKKGLMQKIFSQQIRFKDSNNNPYPDWEEKYVNEVCDISTGKGNTQDKEDNGIYPFYVRSPIIERSNKYIFDGEAVLTVGDGVGTGKVYHYVNGKFNFHQRVYKMSNFNGILGKYFYYYFSTHFYDRVKKMTAKTSVDSVRLEMISKMTLLIPCQEEQEKIAKVLSKMDELIEEKKALLSDWQRFKKGLLQQMFV